MSGIAILGMGRSGTKFLTEALAACGCHVGSVNWAAEHHGVRAINDELLARFCDAKLGKLPYGHAREFSIPSEYHERAAGVIDTLEQDRLAAGKRYWLFKDPRTTLLTGLWLPHVDIVVGLFRRPSEVIESYVKHRFIEPPDARAILTAYWLRFNGVLWERFQSQEKPTFLLHFGKRIDAQIARLAQALGLPYCDSVRFQPQDKHFNHDDSPSSLFLPEESDVHTLYRQLKQHSFENAVDSRLSASTR